MKQQSFALLDYAHKKKQTRRARARFLSEMERCMAWLAVIEPHYPCGGRRGGQPPGLEVMLRIYLMQQWFRLPVCSRQVSPIDGRQFVRGGVDAAFYGAGIE